MGAVDWTRTLVPEWAGPCWAEGAQVEWREGCPAQALGGAGFRDRERSAEAPPVAGRG